MDTSLAGTALPAPRPRPGRYARVPCDRVPTGRGATVVVLLPMRLPAGCGVPDSVREVSTPASVDAFAALSCARSFVGTTVTDVGPVLTFHLLLAEVGHPGRLLVQARQWASTDTLLRELTGETLHEPGSWARLLGPVPPGSVDPGASVTSLLPWTTTVLDGDMNGSSLVVLADRVGGASKPGAFLDRVRAHLRDTAVTQGLRTTPIECPRGRGNSFSDELGHLLVVETCAFDGACEDDVDDLVARLAHEVRQADQTFLERDLLGRVAMVGPDGGSDAAHESLQHLRALHLQRMRRDLARQHVRAAGAAVDPAVDAVLAAWRSSSAGRQPVDVTATLQAAEDLAGDLRHEGLLTQQHEQLQRNSRLLEELRRLSTTTKAAERAASLLAATVLATGLIQLWVSLPLSAVARSAVTGIALLLVGGLTAVALAFADHRGSSRWVELLRRPEGVLACSVLAAAAWAVALLVPWEAARWTAFASGATAVLAAGAGLLLGHSYAPEDLADQAHPMEDR